LDHYDSPPPPPQSLEDQLHVAYALDDIRLAKILLLKLKGVILTSDDDPRIDAVRDEDFDECFVPAGGLDLGECAKKSREDYQGERRRREKEIFQEEQRMARLKECERRWDAEKRRVQQERMVERKRDDQRRNGQRKGDAVKMRSTLTPRPGLRRSVIAYGTTCDPPSSPVASTSKLYDDPFQYDVMPATRRNTTPRHYPKTKVSSSTPSSSVTFKAVMESMSGPLFPLDPSEQTRLQDQLPKDVRAKDLERSSWPINKSSTSSRALQTSVQRELLAKLLKVVEWEDGERKRIKGKSAEVPRTNPNPKTPCAACSAASSRSGSASSATPSRSSSWLSFGGSSQSSTSTAATTPSTSPISSWLKGGSSLRASSSMASPPLPSKQVSKAPNRLSCPHSKGMTHVLPSDSPLPIPVDRPNPTHLQKLDGTSLRRSSLDDDDGIIVGSGKEKNNTSVLKRVRTLVEFATTLQLAYIGATVLGVVAVSDNRDVREERPPTIITAKKIELKPPGFRASRSDVLLFTSLPTDDSVPPANSHQFIPLTSTGSSSQTELPHRTLTFPPPAPVPRSPFRPVVPPPALLWRPRPVANPMILRLKALQNIMCERGKEWEGRGRDGGLGCGKDKLVGVAWEGLGRSGLGWEVGVISAC
jgi:hypothetical protein